MTVDYCELMAPLPILSWAEPLNFMTNIAFLVAAALLAKRWLKWPLQYAQQWPCMVLIVFLIGIGLGSGYWHFHQTTVGVILDVAFIQLFLLFYLMSYAKFVWNYTWLLAGGLAALYFAANMLGASMIQIPFAPSSGAYVPTLVLMMVLCVESWRNNRMYTKMWLMLIVLFAASLTLRSVDLLLCHVWPVGTHIFWHILNALVLFFAVDGVAQQFQFYTSSRQKLSHRK